VCRDLTVCVFTNPPLPGKAKTRLIPTLGPEGAADLARAMLLDTVEVARSVPDARVVLAVAAPLPEELNLSAALPRRPQGGGDLGQRMERALRLAIEEEAAPAVLIGTDLPGLPASRLEQARQALLSADAVLGPAEDGGFYLIGLRRAPGDGLLDNLPWSARNTFAATMARLQERGLKTATIDPWFDLDVPEDLARVREGLSTGTIHAPHLAAALTS